MSDLITLLVLRGWCQVYDRPGLITLRKRDWRVDVFANGRYLLYRK